MPKVNVYLPDDLAAAVREAGIPVSSVCQEALADALRRATALREGGSRCRDVTLPPGFRIGRQVTARLARALELAYEEARKRNHHVGTEHLLLGMLEENENLGVRVISALDVMPADLANELEAAMRQELPAGGPDSAGEPELTPRAREALDVMVKEAKQLGHNYVGCEHLLLGLIRTGGIGGHVLRTLGLDVAVTRRAVVTSLSGFVHARANPTVPAAVEDRLEEIAARLARLEDRFE